MNDHLHAWAVVLATAENTTDPALLSQGLQRALAVTPCARVCSVVTRAQGPTPDGVITQPADRGSAHSLLLALLHVAARDTEATVAVFPTDHFVRDEVTLAESMRDVVGLAKARPETVYLLGMEPDQPRFDCGFILPKHRDSSGAARVAGFGAATSPAEARALQDEGGLWNLGVLAASLSALLALYERDFAATLAVLRSEHTPEGGMAQAPPAAQNHFRRLASRDLTRDVLAGQEEKLRVVPVAHCGWTDTAAALSARLTPRQKRAGSYGESMRVDAAESAPPGGG